jgi:hypothetical protein
MECPNEPIQIFFLGDHDASGHVIEEDIHQVEFDCIADFAARIKGLPQLPVA